VDIVEILNKKHFFDMAKNGTVGNTPKCWMTIDEYEKDQKFYPTVTFRSYNLGKFKEIPPWIKGKDIFNIASKLKKDTYIIMEAPNEDLNDRYGLQGELNWYDGKWILFYTHKLGYMREKLSIDGKHAFGLQAINLIKSHASPSGIDMLFDLFERFSSVNNYPVIEFAVLPKSVGVFLMDTLIWEVRNKY
jgi:hypothetical protein